MGVINDAGQKKTLIGLKIQNQCNLIVFQINEFFPSASEKVLMGATDLTKSIGVLVTRRSV